MRSILIFLFSFFILSSEKGHAGWPCGETLASVAYDFGILRYLVKTDSWWKNLPLRASAKEVLDQMIKESSEKSGGAQSQGVSDYHVKFIAYENETGDLMYLFWDVDARFRPVFGDGFRSDGFLHHKVVEEILSWRNSDYRILFGSSLGFTIGQGQDGSYLISNLAVLPRSAHMQVDAVPNENHLRGLIGALRTSGLLFTENAQMQVGWMKSNGASKISSTQKAYSKKISAFLATPLSP